MLPFPKQPSLTGISLGDAIWSGAGGVDVESATEKGITVSNIPAQIHPGCAFFTMWWLQRYLVQLLHVNLFVHSECVIRGEPP
jgi:lactate dehydrogenase-like 2-hydroxyacid dehydrogenase